MAGFRNVSDYANAWDAGRVQTCSIRKVPSQASTAGQWVDLSMAAGNPKPNYYASSPLVAATLAGLDGIYHGSARTPSTTHLAEMCLMTPTAGLVGRYMLLDFLMYYPFIDLDDGDAQAMDNTVTLPRYESGDGVMAMLVAAAPTVGAGQFTFDYVNQDGVAKTSPVQFCGTAASTIASIITSQPGTAGGQGPFLKLADGDTGIRAVTGWTNTVLNGGLGSLVLVKPLADHTIREINTASEVSWVKHRAGAPRIFDGAYLNLIMNCAATVAAGTVSGRMSYVWSE